MVPTIVPGDAFDSFTVDIIDDTGTVTQTMDSAGADAGIMHLDAESLGVAFGLASQAIAPGDYTLVYRVLDATYTNGWRVEEEAKLTMSQI